MLSLKQNLIETISGGTPDRLVKQYEFMRFISFIPDLTQPKIGETITNEWGVTLTYRQDQLSSYPVHDAEHIVLKDITQWEKYVHAPEIPTSDSAWRDAQKHSASIDRNNEYATVKALPGLFEMTHYLMGMEDAMISLYTHPDKMKALIAYLEEYEIERAKVIIKNVNPDCFFHHDDWGTQRSTFISPKMFEEFYMPSYERIYGFYKDSGIELIVHHSDSYAATLVPHMIKMGIDIWQGVMTTNNIPELIKKYGGKITFMGGLDNGILDRIDWTYEKVEAEVEKVLSECGKKYFIPCLTRGGNASSIDGVYDAVNTAIDKINMRQN